MTSQANDEDIDLDYSKRLVGCKSQGKDTPEMRGTRIS